MQRLKEAISQRKKMLHRGIWAQSVTNAIEKYNQSFCNIHCSFRWVFFSLLDDIGRFYDHVHFVVL